MSRWRDLLLVIVLFAVLIGFTVYSAQRAARDADGPPGSVHSARDQGAYALRRWLQSLGYDARPLQYTDWQLPHDADALFMLAPAQAPITNEEAQETLRWVRDGGTLILIVPGEAGFGTAPLLEALGVEISTSTPELFPETSQVPITQPVLTTPPTTQVTVDDRSVVTPERDAYVPLVTTDKGDVLVGFVEDQGYVYVGTSLAPFANGSIRQPDNPQLVLNLVRRVAPGGQILFDEYHHGFRTIPDATRTMFDYWWGRATLYALLVTGLYLILTGRRFGKAVPLPADVARRSSAEYVESLGTIFRRAGKRDFIAQHYHDRFKRRIARPYGFVPPDDDEAFLHEVQRYAAPTGDQLRALRRALEALRHARSDEQLVQAVRDADALIDERGRLRR